MRAHSHFRCEYFPKTMQRIKFSFCVCHQNFSHWLHEYILSFYFAIVLFTFIYSIFEQNLWMQWIIYLAGAAATFAFQLTRIVPRRVASHRSASRCVAQWHKFQLENVFCVNCKPINDAPPICVEWRGKRFTSGENWNWNRCRRNGPIKIN